MMAEIAQTLSSAADKIWILIGVLVCSLLTYLASRLGVVKDKRVDMIDQRTASSQMEMERRTFDLQAKVAECEKDRVALHAEIATCELHRKNQAAEFAANELVRKRLMDENIELMRRVLFRVENIEAKK